MNLKVNRCCGMNLRTAGLVLGWLHIVFSSLFIAFRIIITLSVLDSNKIYSSTQNTNENAVIALAISIATSLLNLLVSALLIEGIQKNKHRFLLPWLILTGIGLILEFFAVGAFTVASVVMIALQPAQIVLDVILVFFYGLGCWAWIAVYSLYQEIRMAAVRKLLPFNESGLVEKTSPYQCLDK